MKHSFFLLIISDHLQPHHHE